jgi:hypothetical protein
MEGSSRHTRGSFTELVSIRSSVPTKVSISPVFRSSVNIDMSSGHVSFYTYVLPALNNLHHLRTFLALSPNTSTSWRWISTARVFQVKNRITKRASNRHGNQFTQWLVKYCGCGTGSDDSSRPLKPPAK